MTDSDVVVSLRKDGRTLAVFEEGIVHHEYARYRDEFALVAVFDRKANEHDAKSNQAVYSQEYQRWLCRDHARRQPPGGKPQFFYVIGPKEHGPWRLIRLNLRSGEWEREWQLNEADWNRVWQLAGIPQTRDILRHWLMQQGGAD